MRTDGERSGVTGLARLVRFLTVWHHYFVTVTRMASGRWYIFRDRPDWFVRGVAETPIEAADAEESKEWVAAAQTEWKLRKRTASTEVLPNRGAAR